MVPVDPISIIERSLVKAKDMAAWWARIAECVAPELGRDCGMYAYTMRLDELRPTRIVNLGASQATIDATIEGAERADRRAALAAVDPVGLFASSEVFGDTELAPDARDSLALSIPDGEGAVHVMIVPSPRRERVGEDARLVWQRLALHLGAGVRLQRQAGTLEDPEVEAVLSPDGALVHADSVRTDAASRDQLRDATRRLDRLRARRGRPSATEALELWQGLLLGRWSMVDHFDTDGRHFLLARRNDPDAPAPRQLTRRQRQVVFYASLGFAHKHTGYALGLAESTIATHLNQALEKLGIQSREELIQIVAQIVGAARTP